MGSIRPFTLKDEPIENLRPLKVRVIGCGYSGIYLGIRIPQRLRHVDLQIYEKNEGIGGTWWENRYPGRFSFSNICKHVTNDVQVAHAISRPIATSILSIRIRIGLHYMRPPRRFVHTYRALRISTGL
jgi:hypothetical protein